MTYNPAKHHRRSIRLKGYDYSQEGAYFVTMCTQNRSCLFGEIVNGEMKTNDAGRMIQTVWDEMPLFYPNIEIDEFVVMPNHIHGIIIITPDSHGLSDPDIVRPLGQPRGGAPTGVGLSLPDAVHRLKTMTTKRYTDGVKQMGWRRFSGKLWQRNYWEHIVRNEPELNRIQAYIRNNPAKWEIDKLRTAQKYDSTLRENIAEYNSEPWMI